MPYDFSAPDARFALPSDLREISGLTVYDSTTLAAVQDEDGRIYRLDQATGDVLDRSKFAGKGDYEGIERVEDRLYVLRSDGTLFEIRHPFEKRQKVHKHDTRLSARYDTEGLYFDAPGRRLLIACKEYPGKGLKGVRAIYAYDLDREKVGKHPVMRLSLQSVQDTLRRHGRLTNRLFDWLTPGTHRKAFKPSALARHPVTGDFLVLSSVFKAIVVVTPAGAIRTVWPLDPGLFPQPEGLAVREDGELFISNEGRPATLLRFAYHPRP